MRRINLYVTGPAVESWLARQRNANAAINEILEAFVTGKPTERETALRGEIAALERTIERLIDKRGAQKEPSRSLPDTSHTSLDAIDLGDL